MTDAIGWVAAALLLLTMSSQVWKQWKSGEVSGVSKFLFLGQLLASGLFALYSLLKSDAVFTVVNSFMVISAVLGYCVDQRNRRTQTQVNLPKMSTKSRLTHPPSSADRLQSAQVRNRK